MTGLIFFMFVSWFVILTPMIFFIILLKNRIYELEYKVGKDAKLEPLVKIDDYNKGYCKKCGRETVLYINNKEYDVKTGQLKLTKMYRCPKFWCSGI